MKLKLVQPYPSRGLTLKQHYLFELEDKSAKHIYFHYEDEETGKLYMKQIPYLEAQVIVNDL